MGAIAEDGIDNSNEYLEIDEELYNRLAKLRNQGSSKGSLIKLLEEEKHDPDDALKIAERIEEDFRDYKNDKAMEYRKYGFIALGVGVVLFLIRLFYFQRFSLTIIFLDIAIIGYFYSKYATIKRVLGFY